MTFKELLRIREETYRVPDTPRCETCKHCEQAFRHYCHLPAGRGKLSSKRVEPSGVCDLWEEAK